MSNYNAIGQIISALNNVNLVRLKHVWKQVSPKSTAEFETLETLMSMDKNFKSYRQDITKKGECNVLPYMPLHLKDLFMIQEQNIAKREKKSLIVLDDIQTMGKIIDGSLSSVQKSF